MRDQNILISGASVAGPALAFWLRRYGFNPTIVERAPAVREGGYAVDFRGASVRVLERMGLLGQVQEKQTRIRAITIVDRENKKVASMPDGFTSGELEILRGDLAAIFHEATRETTEYIFDDTIEAMEQSADGVAVRFESGARRRFDLVVGADGVCTREYVCLPLGRSRALCAIWVTSLQFSRFRIIWALTGAGSTTERWARRWASSAAATRGRRKRRSFCDRAPDYDRHNVEEQRRFFGVTFSGRAGRCRGCWN